MIFGFIARRAGDGDALLLAAGKIGRVDIGFVRYADAIQKLGWRFSPRR